MNEFNIFSSTRPLFEYLKQQQENRRFTKSIELGVTFLLISFFLFFAIKPTAFTISTLIGETTSKEILSKQMRSKINNIIQAQDNFARIEQRYQVIEDALPDSPKYSDAVVQVQGAARESLVGISKINFNIVNTLSDKNNPNLNSFSITTSTGSNFFSVLNLLNRLSNNRRLMDFSNINFSNERSASAENQVNFNFSTNFFYWNQQL